MEGTKYELRLALSQLLNIFLLFRVRCSNLGSGEDKELKLHMQKLDKIYEQIVYIKLVQLIDEEHTLEEEVDELKNAICILLKFFDTTKADPIPTVLEEKVISINFEQAMKCTADEFETALERYFLKKNYS